MDRVSKASARIEAYGSVDELNATVGVVRPTGYDDIDNRLRSIQNQLHIVQAEFSNPDPDEGDPVVEEAHVEQLENWIDDWNQELSPLEDFILPGGSDPGSRLHHARAVCRRAERRAIALVAEEAAVNETGIVYLNRLSDALFTIARLVNDREDISEETPTY
jgi:cob(I)alamin adenosyltransferase